MAYLPPKTSVGTLKDFIEILDPTAQVIFKKNQSKILARVEQEEVKINRP